MRLYLITRGGRCIKIWLSLIYTEIGKVIKTIYFFNFTKTFSPSPVAFTHKNSW